jgi:uncharacterized protein (DUF983 family)
MFASAYFVGVIAGVLGIGFALMFIPFTKDSDYWMQWVVLFAVFPFLMLWQFTSLAVIQSIKKRMGLAR